MPDFIARPSVEESTPAELDFGNSLVLNYKIYEIKVDFMIPFIYKGFKPLYLQGPYLKIMR